MKITKGGENMNKLNAPQKEKINIIIALAQAFNNYADCDEVFETVRHLEKVETIEDANETIDYLITCIHFKNGTEFAKRISIFAKEVRDYTSLLTAVQSGNKDACAYFEKQMRTEGMPTRIM